MEKDLVNQIEEIVLDAGIAERIMQVAASSMGQELIEEDLVNYYYLYSFTYFLIECYDDLLWQSHLWFRV